MFVIVFDLNWLKLTIFFSLYRILHLFGKYVWKYTYMVNMFWKYTCLVNNSKKITPLNNIKNCNNNQTSYTNKETKNVSWKHKIMNQGKTLPTHQELPPSTSSTIRGCTTPKMMLDIAYSPTQSFGPYDATLHHRYGVTHYLLDSHQTQFHLTCLINLHNICNIHFCFSLRPISQIKGSRISNSFNILGVFPDFSRSGTSIW